MADTNQGSPIKENGAIKGKGRDFYKIIGVDKNATQGQIKSAYRKLAMKNHPDKNPGDDAAAERFKEISTAYAVLSDPNKKRQYDLHGEDGSIAEIATINVEEMGTLGRMFGALVSKAGIPVPTEISVKVLSNAKFISEGVSPQNGETLPQVVDVVWGQTISHGVDRQDAHFYRITLTDEDLKKGVILQCKSKDADKFKVVFFDQSGHVSIVEESMKRKKYSDANIYFSPFPRYHLGEYFSINMLKCQEDDLPPVFFLLDSFDRDTSKNITAGTHLFCIYGDNWFQSVKYTLRPLVAVEPSVPCVNTIQETELKLEKVKLGLENFQQEFVDAKKKYEEACKRIEEDVKEMTETIQKREEAYNEYMSLSAKKYEHIENAAPSQKKSGLFSKFF